MQEHSEYLCAPDRTIKERLHNFIQFYEESSAQNGKPLMKENRKQLLHVITCSLEILHFFYVQIMSPSVSLWVQFLILHAMCKYILALLLTNGKSEFYKSRNVFSFKQNMV